MHTPIFMQIGMQTNKNMHRESERHTDIYANRNANKQKHAERERETN